jgi:hypothetical protein
MSNTTTETGADLHARALALIAAENTRAGRPIDDYDSDQYATAIGTAHEELNGADDHLRAALAQIHGAADTVVTPKLLRDRQQEILEHAGFPRSASGRILAPDGDSIRAMRAAIDELGQPGEPRKDLADVAASRKEALIALAVEKGAIVDTFSVRGMWSKMYDDNPTGTERMLAAFGVAVDETGAEREPSVYERFGAVAHEHTTVSGETLIAPDREGLEIHVRAENLIEAKGWGKRDTRGEVAYDADTYVRALTQIEEDDRWAAKLAEEAAAA